MDNGMEEKSLNAELEELKELKERLVKK